MTSASRQRLTAWGGQPADEVLRHLAADDRGAIFGATVYARRGDIEQAFGCLRRLLPGRAHPQDLRCLTVDPQLARVRVDRRWPAFWSPVQRELRIPG